MIAPRQIPRLLRIAGVLARHRIDDLLPPARRPRALAWLRALLPAPPADVMALPRGERFVRMLTGLGPIFVKFGQILSTRRDLLPPTSPMP